MEVTHIDTAEARSLLFDLTRRYGRTPEHNADWFLSVAKGEVRPPLLIHLSDGRAVLAYDDGNEWGMLEEPLVPTEDVARTVCDFAREALASSLIKKVVVELKTPVRKEVLGMLPKTLKARAINYTMTWPVYDMHAFDSALPGGHWKTIRNARNKLYREHQVEVRDAREVDTHDLHGLVDRWKSVRGAHDRAYDGRYHACIENVFAGFVSARAIFVDGQLAGINGGWKFPGKPGYYYGAVGIHDYAFQDIGVVLYLEDFMWIKNAGYAYADMAGGEKELTRFKNQFQPVRWYKTHVFSIVRA
ncbi:MAG: GNAT family N-acetyltransferase [Patescibacteria group bacterium]